MFGCGWTGSGSSDDLFRSGYGDLDDFLRVWY
jgi:hypothetical protein